MFCSKCGSKTSDSEKFCAKCGTALTPDAKPAQAAVHTPQATQPFVQQAPQPVQPRVYTQPPYAQPQPNQSKPKKDSKALLIVLICVLGTALVAALFIFLLGGTQSASALPEIKYSYLSAEKTVDVDFEYADKIYPSLYPSMDSVIIFKATSEGGDSNVLVSVEIPGFTQAYEQKFTLSEQITQLYIKPPVLTGELSLDSSKDAQLVFSVTDMESGKLYVKESAQIKLMSKFDFILWEDKFGKYNLDNALAWLTPESEGILELRRNAIEWLTQDSQGAFNTLQGYQLSSMFGANEREYNVLYQILGIQGAMSDMGVRYNVGAFSMTEGYHQRVLLPDDVLKSKSGICIETSLVMASALQSAGMHVMLVFPPGHAQVAVETWEGSGEYFLIETTVLPFGENNHYSEVVREMNDSEWLAYLADPWGDGSGPCYVVDCDLATKLGITALTN